MNLVIDVGNSSVKLAVFKKDELIFKTTVKLSEVEEEIEQFMLKFPSLNRAIVSSVGKLKNTQIKAIRSKIELFELTHKSKLPFKNEYDTPTTLGIDRIALVAASVFQYPKVNTLIIDAGSCITYDFVTDKNEYLGGAISPGIKMRYKAMHNFTANLPFLDTEKPMSFIGSSTNSSMHSGVVNGVVNEIDGFISNYLNEFSDLTVILTGGDAEFLSEQLKSSIFANSNFLLEGLNFILKYNSNE